MPINTESPLAPLVSAQWLFEHLHTPNLIILDASLRASVNGGGIDPALADARIGHAVHFDIDERVCDRTSPLPHTMPTPEHFAAEVRRLGVNRDSTVVIYDKRGLHSAPRAWWMFKVMGHDNVAVLDGGLPAWQHAGYPLHRTPAPLPAAGNFTAAFVAHRLRSASDVLARLDGEHHATVLDARPPARFAGHAPEPRAGLRSGHMPHAINIPFEQELRDGKLLPRPELAALFAARIGDNTERELIASCGSGVTACLLLLAAYCIGYRTLALYDGSWSEWGALPDYPVIRD